MLAAGVFKTMTFIIPVGDEYAVAKLTGWAWRTVVTVGCVASGWD